MPEAFLRYRFESGDQIRRHFHVAGDRAMLFYPHADRTLQQGARVALEIGFTQSDQRCSAYGQVHSATEAPRGVWLEFSSHAVTSGIEEALRRPKRRSRRVPTNFLVSVSSTPTVSHLARLLDVSTGSARLGDTSVHTGDHLWLRVLGALPQMPGDLGPARVTWVRDGEAGVRLLNGTVGRAIVMNLLTRVDEQWAGAKTVTHAALCHCTQGGEVTEPPPPGATLEPLLDRRSRV